MRYIIEITDKNHINHLILKKPFLVRKIDHSNIQVKGLRKHKRNALVDVISFICFLILTSTGLLIHFVLPPGSGHHKVLMGMNRHEWGDIHFWFGLIFIISIIGHLLQHQKWISVTFRFKSGHQS